MSLYDYVQVIKRVKKSNKRTYEEDTDGTRRPFNKRFTFDDRHPLSKDYEQQVRLLILVPALTGRRRPKCPGPRLSNIVHASSTVRDPRKHITGACTLITSADKLVEWQRCADEYALYMSTLFIPWNTNNGRCEHTSWDAFCAEQ